MVDSRVPCTIRQPCTTWLQKTQSESIRERPSCLLNFRSTLVILKCILTYLVMCRGSKIALFVLYSFLIGENELLFIQEREEGGQGRGKRHVSEQWWTFLKGFLYSLFVGNTPSLFRRLFIFISEFISAVYKQLQSQRPLVSLP